MAKRFLLTSMIEITKATKSYQSGPAAIHALHELSLTIADKEFVAITGPSGCGKSTLLNLIGGLDKPSQGSVVAAGVALHTAGAAELTQYRRLHLGMVFQFFNLLPTMSVVENVELPLLLQRRNPTESRLAAEQMLELVGLEDRRSHFPHQMSGGQLQRAAIARALVHHPAILLADEPTGNLDSGNAARILELFRKIASQKRTTMVVVTHSNEVAQAAERQIALLDGKRIS